MTRLLQSFTTLVCHRLPRLIPQHSFFSQFCAGEDSEDIKPSLARLRKAGIGAILDYAAEADVAPSAQAAAPPPPAAGGTAAPGATMTAGIGNSSPGHSSATGHARPGHVAGSAADSAAEAEADLDGHLALTITGVRDAGAEAAAGSAGASSSSGGKRSPAETAAAATAGFGFAAVKLTSLARPELLQRVSSMLHEHRRAWRRFNVAAPPCPNPYLDLSVSREAFVRALRGPSLSQEDAGDLFTAMDYAAGSTPGGSSTSPTSSSSLDYLEWSDFCALLSIGGVDAHAAAAYAVRGGTPASLLSVLAPAGGAASLLTEAEQAQWRRVLRRAHELGAAAAAHGVTIMVDAEQTYLQPSIDFLVTTMQRQFNRPLLPQGAAGAGSGPVWVPPESAHVLHRAGASLAALTQSREAGVGSMAAAAVAAGAPPLSALPVGAAGPGVRQSNAASLSGPAWPYCDARLMAQRNGRTGRAVQSAAAAAAAAELRSSGSSASSAGSAVPFVYNTFQAYLTDTPSRLALALRRSEREGWLFGAKLVRGAYMVQERALAAEKGYKDPIHANVQATHDCYHACADAVLDAAAGKGAEVMIASHNEGSVRYVAQRMGALGLGPQGECAMRLLARTDALAGCDGAAIPGSCPL